MSENEIRPRDCPHCELQDGQWSMQLAAKHFREVHPGLLDLLKDAITLFQASQAGMEPWNG